METKETLNKVIEYTENEKKMKAKKMNKYFSAGLTCIVLVILNRQFGILSYVFQENVSHMMNGALCSLGLLFEFIGFYNINHDITLRQKKIALINNFRK